MSATAIPAVVLSCIGAPEGDLSLVRSLGEQGVPVIVLSEYGHSPSRRSRYCRAFLEVPDFASNPSSLLRTLREVRERLGTAPVLFPSADPDLAALLDLDGQLDGLVRRTLPPAALAHQLLDKHGFEALALQEDLPVPRSLAVGDAERGEVLPDWRAHCARLRFPLVAKPVWSHAWQTDTVPQSVRSAKALHLANMADVEALAASLPTASWACTLLQEYVPGSDDEHFGVHAYIDREGRVLGTSVTRNWRVYPPHAGGGCCMESIHEPTLEAQALDALRRVGFRGGIANMDYKRNAQTGEFRLLEINPRISQAHILSTRAGVNFPWLAWRDACGLPPLPPPSRRIGVRYINELDDLLARRRYAREGQWRWPSYLRHVLGPGRVYQLTQLHDLAPLGSALRYLSHRLLVRRGGRTPFDPNRPPPVLDWRPIEALRVHLA